MKKKKADQTPTESPPAPKPENNGINVIQVTSLDQLQVVCEQTLHVQFLMPKADGGANVMLIPVRLLRPDESEQIELIIKEAHPKVQKVQQSDGTFITQIAPPAPEDTVRAAHLQKVARAVALWWACPLFKSSEQGKKLDETIRSKPNPLATEGGNRDAIFDFIQSKFTEKILHSLYSLCRAEEFQLEERVNFTTPPK